MTLRWNTVTVYVLRSGLHPGPCSVRVAFFSVCTGALGRHGYGHIVVTCKFRIEASPALVLLQQTGGQ